MNITSALQAAVGGGLMAFGGPAGMMAGASLAGGAMSNIASSQQAQRQMDFQANMSGSSYQRGMADMRAAGLNPMLAYMQGGASTPGGAMAQQTDVVSPAVHSALDTKRAIAEVDTMRTEQDKNKAETKVADAMAANYGAETALKAAQIPRANWDAKVQSGWLGKAGAYVRGVTGPLGDVLGTVVPSFAAAKGLFMAKKYLDSQDPLERTKSSFENSFANERGRIFARRQFGGSVRR